MGTSIAKPLPFVAKSGAIYSKEELATVDLNKIPSHIAIIPDGNRRWAMRQQKETRVGHQHGADTLIETMRAAKELGVKTVTFYTFSTENWRRPQEEVDGLMWLLESYLIEQRSTMIEEGIRLYTIGNLKPLPLTVQETIKETKKCTEECSIIDIVLAINYGSRDEICRAITSLVADVAEKKLDASKITEELLSSYLDTKQWCDPDLLIRTSGEQRISNFLNWQLSYSEIYTPQVLWPDFTPTDFLQAIQHYQSRKRRHGH